MNELQTTKEEIYKILKKEPNTRNSDMLLYLSYCKNHWVRETELYRVFEDSKFRKSKYISPFNTVSRCRRELQSEFIELKAEEKIQELRNENEEKYNNFFGKGERLWLIK